MALILEDVFCWQAITEWKELVFIVILENQRPAHPSKLTDLGPLKLE